MGVQHASKGFVCGENKTRAPSDTVASKGDGMVGISALPTFYFDPTENRRIKEALIPDPTSCTDDDATFPSGRYRLSLAKITEKKGAAFVDFTVQEDFGKLLKKSYTSFVSLQDEPLHVLPSSIASRQSMALLDGWFHCMVQGKNFVVGDIEFKASYYSTIEGLPQAFTYTTSIVLNLLNVGMAPEDIIVPVMVSNGHLVQFACMFCENDLPLPLTISSVIDTLDAKGRVLAHEYMLKIKSHVESLQVKLQQLEGDLFSDPKDWQSALPIPDSVHPKMGYVTAQWHEDDLDASCRHIFETLSKLWGTPAWKFVCPPLGFSTHTRLATSSLHSQASGALLFLDLRKRGFSNLPPSFEHAKKYVNGLTAACSAFHEEGVVHGDLYPSNVFWKAEPFEVRIIDWDTAFATTEFLPAHIQDMWSTTSKWKWFITCGEHKKESLDNFMMSALIFASEDESVWKPLSDAENESSCNDAFRQVQKQFADSYASTVQAMENLTLSA